MASLDAWNRIENDSGRISELLEQIQELQQRNGHLQKLLSPERAVVFSRVTELEHALTVKDAQISRLTEELKSRETELAHYRRPRVEAAHNRSTWTFASRTDSNVLLISPQGTAV
eukprot:gnl/Spiro4/24773_TR12316_c0_g3_i1.p2 gnl/Spiro4/24773_TR12316_c0_g3~~gnl/Spiro4/24773_TR12316_c0_g3_i1.p2  ORF type:complete len:115 (-),score=15.11 gnl/Spiro4/24773_TR12316_c0_g3_i1:216-560(-)